MEGLINGARVARHLGVTPAAVSNWLHRGTLPEHLQPVHTEPVPLWPESQLDELAAWHAARLRPRTIKTGKLLGYVRAAKKAAAVKGHLGLSAESDNYWMGAAWAYQDIEQLLAMTETQPEQQGDSA